MGYTPGAIVRTAVSLNDSISHVNDIAPRCDLINIYLYSCMVGVYMREGCGGWAFAM